MSREEVYERWIQGKPYVGLSVPGTDANGYEKWPRFCAEVPPELAEVLDRVQKTRLGVNVSAFTRAGVVRAALRLYLDTYAPEPPPKDFVEGTATEVIERRLLEAGTP